MKKENVFRRSEKGSLTVEATIVLTMMIFFMLFLISYGRVVQIQNIVSHAMLQSSQSLSVESYGINKLDSSILAKGAQQLFDLIYDSSNSGDGNFANTNTWYDSEGKTVKAVQDRMSAYIGGSNGKTNEILSKLNLKDGLDGIDFSGTKVSGNDLVISVSYDVKLFVPFPGIETVPVKQSVKSRLWK